jgi:DNA-binding IclR family transcriptional regulator
VARTKPIQSVLRGIDLLHLLSEAPEGMRLCDMAEALDLKAPTVHNLARTLSLRGMVTQREGGLYALGPGLSEMAERAGRGRRRRQAEVAVRGLARLQPGPIVNYSEPASTRLVVRLRASPDRPGMVQHPGGHENPIYSTANGLAFLAFAPADQVAALRRAQPFHEYGIRLWPSLDALDEFLDGCRDRGHAVTPFENQELFRVSVPVYDTEGLAVAYLGAAVPVDAPASARSRLVQDVHRAAEAVSERSCEPAEIN